MMATKLSAGVKDLQKALRKDAKLYVTYHSSISMAIKETAASMKMKISRPRLHKLAVDAADKYLSWFIGDEKIPKGR